MTDMADLWKENDDQPSQDQIDMNDILPWEWHHIFRLFPVAPKELIVRALSKEADRWIDSYCSVFRGIYRTGHRPILPEDRINARARIISLMMYGIDYMTFDRCCSSYMNSTTTAEGHISKFLKNIEPLRLRQVVQ